MTSTPHPGSRWARRLTLCVLAGVFLLGPRAAAQPCEPPPPNPGGIDTGAGRLIFGPYGGAGGYFGYIPPDGDGWVYVRGSGNPGDEHVGVGASRAGRSAFVGVGPRYPFPYFHEVCARG